MVINIINETTICEWVFERRHGDGPSDNRTFSSPDVNWIVGVKCMLVDVFYMVMYRLNLPTGAPPPPTVGSPY